MVTRITYLELPSAPPYNDSVVFVNTRRGAALRQHSAGLRIRLHCVRGCAAETGEAHRRAFPPAAEAESSGLSHE